MFSEDKPVVRWELYDSVTHELLDFGAHPIDVAAAMERHKGIGHDFIFLTRTEDELDDAVPWDEIQPKQLLLVDEADTGTVNYLFLGLCLLADDMQEAEDPFTERLDNLIETFFSAVADIPDNE